MDTRALAAAAYGATKDERRAIDEVVLFSKEYVAFVSLHNICTCFLHHRKCEKKLAKNLLKTGHVDTWCYEESDSSGSFHPTKEDIQAEYIAALEMFGSSMPEQLKELFKRAISSKAGHGRGKRTHRNTLELACFAAALYGIAKFENEYNTIVFDIYNIHNARKIFYQSMYGENSVIPERGGADIFARLIKDNMELCCIVFKALESCYHQGMFKNKNFLQHIAKVPCKEYAIYWIEDVEKIACS